MATPSAVSPEILLAMELEELKKCTPEWYFRNYAKRVAEDVLLVPANKWFPLAYEAQVRQARYQSYLRHIAAKKKEAQAKYAVRRKVADKEYNERHRELLERWHAKEPAGPMETLVNEICRKLSWRPAIPLRQAA